MFGTNMSVEGLGFMCVELYVKDTAPNVVLIKSEFKIDELEVPEEIKGEFMCSFSGEAEFEFNYKKHYFESVNIDLHIKMKSDFAKGEDITNVMDMSVESSSNYKVKFTQFE